MGKFEIPSGRPMKIEDIKNPVKVSMGPRASGVITEEGHLYTFGNGNWGILGHGNEKNVSFKTPKLVEKFASRDIKIKDIAFGRYHAAAIASDGSLYTWGYGGKAGYFNYFNQEIGALGHGKIDAFFTPERVDFFQQHNLKVEQVACGINHTVALCDNGQVYTWGQGLYGVLGNGNNSPSLPPLLNEEF
jgi:alpha-tubulin suppressor-like RCC1 family protein